MYSQLAPGSDITSAPVELFLVVKRRIKTHIECPVYLALQIVGLSYSSHFELRVLNHVCLATIHILSYWPRTYTIVR